jgi:photosystem II stability/assembly factor-like uncharacterized protein
LLGALVLVGCKPATSPLAFPGHWEVVRQIDYDDLPESSLKGDIGPAYRVYMVTLAGFHTENFGMTVGPDDDARYTTDGGQSWTRASGALHCRHGLEIVGEKVAWHCGNGGTRLTSDGGRTWRTVAPSPCPYMSFLDARIGWAASAYDLQATADGGASWKEIALPQEIGDIAAIALRSADDGYLLDITGALFVTADGGRSWETRSLGLAPGERLIPAAVGPKAALRFVDALHGMAVFDLEDGSVWYAVTGDGGRSWQKGEIVDLRGRSLYYHLFLAHAGTLLTATDDFTNGANASIVLRYEQP